MSRTRTKARQRVRSRSRTPPPRQGSEGELHGISPRDVIGGSYAPPQHGTEGTGRPASERPRPCCPAVAWAASGEP
eukprot:15431824-Alexandrium_andersonii.AAC.1